MDNNKKEVIPDELHAWRKTIINRFLIISAIAAMAGTGMTALDAFSRPEQWPNVFIYFSMVILLLGLAIFQKVDDRIRAGGVLLVAYLTGLNAFASLGLSGSGRLYMLALPVIALILLGVRSGIVMSVISILTLGAFAFFFSKTNFLQGMLIERNTLQISDWIAESSDTLMLLLVVMVLLILFYRFQEGLIKKEHLAQADLIHAQTLLEEQNLTLEEKVNERTEQLYKTNKIQTALYKIADATSASHDMHEFFSQIHQIVGELMYAGNFFVALVDDQSGILSSPYFVDEKDESFPTSPLDTFHGMTGYVIRTGNPIKHGQENFNALIESGEIELTGTANVDGIGSPLKDEGKTIGAIFVQSYTEGIYYTDQDDEVLAFVANHIGTAVTRFKALEAEHQRNTELALLNDLSHEMSKTLDMNTVTRIVGDKMKTIFGSRSVLIMLLDRKTNLIHIPYEYDADEGGYIDYVEPFPLGKGLSSKVITTGQSLMLGTLEEELENGAYFPPEIIEKGMGNLSQSWLGVPIITNEEVIGLVALADMHPHAYNEANKQLLQTLSSNLGTAIENARLFEVEQQRNSELAIINSIQQGLASKLDMQSIYDLIGEKTREVFHVDVVDIVSYDPAANLITMPYSYEKGDRSVISPQAPYGFRLKVINSGAPLLINKDFKEVASQNNNPLITGEWPRSALFVPLLVGDKVMGVISIQDLDKENAFTESDVSLLQTLSNSMSVAIENARLFDETQHLLKETEQHVAELAAINKVSSALVSELDLDALIKLAGDQIREIFHADIAYVALLDEVNNVIEFPYAYGEEYTPINFGEGLTSKVIQSNEPLLINQDLVKQTSEIGATIVGRLSLSYLGVPVIVSGKAVGVLSVQSTHEGRTFNEGDLNLLSTVAANLSTAIQNVRLINNLQSQKQFSEKLILTSPVAIIILDKDNKVSSWNPAAEKLFGYSQTESVGQYLIDLVSDQGSRAEILSHTKMMAAGQSVHSFVRRSRKDGKNLDLELFAVPVLLEKDREGTFVIYHDITELKRAEAAIMESEQKLADIIDFLPDATLVIDQEGKVIAWNRAIEEMTGINSKDMIGHGNFEYALPFYGERRPILIDLALVPQEEFEARKYEKIKRMGEILIGETYTPTLKSGARYLFAAATPLRDSNGNILGAVETIRDITDRKRSEEELQKAKESADTANQAKSAFLANMSHELRTPLNAIIGFTRIVRRKAEGLLPDKQTENLDKVLVSADHLLNLINTVLDIAKIEAGRMDVLASNFRVNALIDLCYNTTQPLVKPAVSLEKQVDENLSMAYSDQDKIRQIVLNILSNATKFTHAGKITLSARRAGENLQISVIDTGIGISPEALPRIFKEFQQADTSTTRQYGGTGLGLSISRNLAHLLGGDITVESELGKGSTFTLTIPLQYSNRSLVDGNGENLDTAQEIPGSPKVLTTARMTDAKKRVLVIDDDPDAVYLIQENLNRNEFEVIGTRDAHEGLELAGSQQPDAILLDVLLPGTDGWQLLFDLKQNPATSSIPVILLTIVDKKALGFHLGAADYLLKPLDPSAVRESLIKVIGSNLSPLKRVLLVDDDPQVMDVLLQVLPESEFQVEYAKDGLSGLKAVNASHPDIILLDIIMPRMDGFGFIQKLRSDPKTDKIPVIVISVKDLTAEETAFLRENVTAILKKQGFQQEQMIKELHQALGLS